MLQHLNRLCQSLGSQRHVDSLCYYFYSHIRNIPLKICRHPGLLLQLNIHNFQIFHIAKNKEVSYAELPNCCVGLFIFLWGVVTTHLSTLQRSNIRCINLGYLTDLEACSNLPSHTRNSSSKSLKVQCVEFKIINYQNMIVITMLKLVRIT